MGASYCVCLPDCEDHGQEVLVVSKLEDPSKEAAKHQNNGYDHLTSSIEDHTVEATSSSPGERFRSYHKGRKTYNIMNDDQDKLASIASGGTIRSGDDEVNSNCTFVQINSVDPDESEEAQATSIFSELTGSNFSRSNMSLVGQAGSIVGEQDEIKSTRSISGNVAISRSSTNNTKPMTKVTSVLSKLQSLRKSGTKMSVEQLMQEAQALMEVYDILGALRPLKELRDRGTESEDWRHVCHSELYDRFLRRMDLFNEVGRACCEPTEGWFPAFEDGGSTIHGRFDTQDSHILHYRVRVLIPTKLTNAMVVANEIELLPTWNTLVTNPPEKAGRRTAHYMVINYQMSFLGGMYKLDVLNEVRRFTDVEGGFMAEYIESCGEDHPSYRKPRSGYARPQTKIMNIWTACGSDNTVLIQAGTLKLPFSVSKWVASTIGGIAGKFIIGGLIKNSMRSTEPQNPWEELLALDKLGLYARLDACVDCDASRSRSPATFGASDLLSYFQREELSEMRSNDDGVASGTVRERTYSYVPVSPSEGRQRASS